MLLWSNTRITICIAVFSDVNECKNSPCSQQCENSPGSYRCLCNKGFSFNADKGTCEGEIVHSVKTRYLCNTFSIDTGTCEGKVVGSVKTPLVATTVSVTLSAQTQALVKLR